MKKLIIICEGKTETLFVKNVLSNYMPSITFSPHTIPTGSNPQGGSSKGGALNYDRVKRYIENLKFTNDYITTFFDFYGLPNNFPSYSILNSNLTIYQKIDTLEKAFYDDIINDFPSLKDKFFPYIQLHEFETLLFTDIKKAFQDMRISDQNLTNLNDILINFNDNPEEINNSIETAPSKRIIKAFPAFQKTKDGVIGIQNMGLNDIEQKCQHFKKWLDYIRSLQ